MLQLPSNIVTGRVGRGSVNITVVLLVTITLLFLLNISLIILCVIISFDHIVKLVKMLLLLTLKGVAQSSCNFYSFTGLSHFPGLFLRAVLLSKHHCRITRGLIVAY